MAEMTQEMYGATGRVGNKTYYRANGKTVAREIVTPKNPKTDAQTIWSMVNFGAFALALTVSSAAEASAASASARATTATASGTITAALSSGATFSATYAATSSSAEATKAPVG